MYGVYKARIYRDAVGVGTEGSGFCEETGAGFRIAQAPVEIAVAFRIAQPCLAALAMDARIINKALLRGAGKDDIALNH